MRGEGSSGLFVLVGGWPGSGKTTLARALAGQLQLPLLSKDEIKEALAQDRPSAVALDVGRLVEVDTSGPVDVARLAQHVRAA